MRITSLLALSLSLAACSSVGSSADSLLPPTAPPPAATKQIEPAPVQHDAPDALDALIADHAPAKAADTHDASTEAPEAPVQPAAPDDELDANALLAAALPDDAPTEPSFDEAPVPPAEPAATPKAPAPWTPETPVSGSWGVRLVSTLPDTQPPRAVLALGEGGEVVVEPGTMVPKARLVVLAIGREAVQVARIVPEGDRARVETSVLRPFYGGSTRPAPAQ